MERLRDLDRRQWPAPVRVLARPVARPMLRLARSLSAKRERATIDTYLLSHPNSGRTWLRMLIGQAIAAHFRADRVFPSRLEELTRGIDAVPTIRVKHDGTHLAGSWRESESRRAYYRSKDVILLVRDPRDVVVSRYHHLTRRGLNAAPGVPAYHGPLAEFVLSDDHGVRAVIRYMNGWQAARSVPRRMRILRYEDLQHDACTELRGILDFLGVDEIDDATVRAAVERSSFDAMRSIESDGHAPRELRAPATDDEMAFKVRRGRVGGFRDELPAPVADEITRITARELDPGFGYRFDV